MLRMLAIALLVALIFPSLSYADKEVPFTLEDRDRLIRVEQKITEMEKRFEKRFDSIEKQIDRLSAIFTALVVAVIAFAYWDRRTVIRKAREETIGKIEKEVSIRDLRNLLNALREKAKSDESLAEILRESLIYCEPVF